MKVIKNISIACFVLLIAVKAFGDVKVYICLSETSVAYHSKKECRGLQKCTHQIISISQSKAINEYNKRACKLCY